MTVYNRVYLMWKKGRMISPVPLRMCGLLGYEIKMLHSCLVGSPLRMKVRKHFVLKHFILGAAGCLPEAGEFPLKSILCFESTVIGIFA